MGFAIMHKSNTIILSTERGRPRLTVSLCIKVALYRFNGALRNKFASYSTDNASPASGLVRTWGLFVWSPQCSPATTSRPRHPPSNPPNLPPFPSAALPLLRPSLLSFSFDASVNRDTESISLLAPRCHLHRDINSEKLLTSERRGGLCLRFLGTLPGDSLDSQRISILWTGY